MRTFFALNEAIREIRRDLSKASVHQSSRVQHLTTEGRKMAEAMNYQFSLPITDVSRFSAQALTVLGANHFRLWEENQHLMAGWLSAELENRTRAGWCLLPNETPPAEKLHPELSKMFEGNWLSYTYAERMQGWSIAMLASLGQDGSRRAFWPIFNATDALRSSRPTRIPCTIGYQWNLRGGKLDCTIIQRSCDFEKFWLSDLWFGAQLTAHLASMRVHEDDEFEVDPRLGIITHTITSFHKFVEAEDIY